MSEPQTPVASGATNRPPLMRAAPDSRAQLFFETLAAEMRKPHFGQQFAEIYRGILLRAEEAGIYLPPKDTK